VESAGGDTISGRFVARSALVALLALSPAASLALQQSAPTFPEAAPLPETLPGTVVPLPSLPSPVWWTVPLPAGTNGPPIIAGDHVFVTRLPGTIVAYRLQDGDEAWATDLVPEQPLVVDGDLVVVASGDTLHALRSADGRTAWRTTVGRLTAPLLAKDGWVIAVSDAKLTAIRSSDGGQIWSAEVGPVRERSAIQGDLLFVPIATGAIEARALITGERRWERRLGGAPQEPLAIGDRLFFGASNRQFYALKIDSGEPAWVVTRLGGMVKGAPVTDGERVYYVSLDHLVRALDHRQGALRWHTPIKFRPWTGPLLIGPRLLVSGAVQALPVLDLSTGRLAATVPFEQDLAVPPGTGTVKGVHVLAAVTGSLAESWRLTLMGVW
jgi:outer membrane protein assembly factor BamB